MSLNINNFNTTSNLQFITGKRKLDEISTESTPYTPFTQRRRGPIPPLKITEVAKSAIEEISNVDNASNAKKQKIEPVNNVSIQNTVTTLVTKTIVPTVPNTTMVAVEKKDPVAAFQSWFKELTKDFNPKSDEAFMLSQHEVISGLSLLTEIPDYNERIGQFQKLFRKGSFWLELDKSTTPNNNTDKTKTCLVVTFKEDKNYNSEGIHHDYLGLDVPLHHYLKVFEYNEKKESFANSNPILKIRSCVKNGELSWIQKGKAFSGNEVLDLYRMFEPLYKGQTMYIFDDSAIKVKDTDNKVKKVLLRVFFALGRQDCKTYYENLGYKELPELNWKDSKGWALNHRVKEYTKDRDFLRNLKMKEVYAIFSSVGVTPLVNSKGEMIKNEKGQTTLPFEKKQINEKITDLLNKVFPNQKPNKFYSCEKTLHDFIEGIILLKKNNLATDEETQQAELLIQESLFNTYYMRPKTAPAIRYKTALETLDSTVIRTKVIT